jgi:hypothetical protein
MDFLIGVVVGSVLGYGGLEAMSRDRRARARREKEMMDHEFSINGATVGKRQPLISADSNFGRGGGGTDLRLLSPSGCVPCGPNFERFRDLQILDLERQDRLDAP